MLVTGRPIHATKEVAELLGLPQVWVAASNGAVAAKFAGNTWSQAVIASLEVGPIARLARACDPHVGVAAEVMGEGYRINRPMPGEIAPKPQLPWDGGPETSPFVTLAPSTVPASEVEEAIRGLGHQTMRWSAASGEVVDIHPADVDKGSAVKALAEQLGLTADQCAAIGDYLNDIPMLAWAGWAVAMGHAPVEVRLTATTVTRSFEDDGLIPVLDALSR